MSAMIYSLQEGMYTHGSTYQDHLALELSDFVTLGPVALVGHKDNCEAVGKVECDGEGGR